MIIKINIPTPGESITEVDLARWLVEDGDLVMKDQEIAEVESDKATLPLIAEKSGKLKILVKEGETVKVGTVACTIDTNRQPPDAKAGEKTKQNKKDAASAKKIAEIKKPVVEKGLSSTKDAGSTIRVTPLARKMMDKEGLSVDDIVKGLRKITSQEVRKILDRGGEASGIPQQLSNRNVRKESLSQLRKKLAKRLITVKNETAMLTTFNEVDMSRVMELRKKYQEKFTEKHGVKLGLMSFFVKAVTIALQEFPRVNSMLEDEQIVTPQYVDISIAVQTEKGLMVPVLRNTEVMSLAAIEKGILDLAEKARKFRLSIEEMSGGTFSITNGGVFGSMLSTPIINPPQSGILGMHNIVERPVAVNGRVEVRPVMYVALSYDHRIIDGRDSVSFLVKVKELLEAPEKMIFGGHDPERLLLEI
jgi:2-oxoglutarate dehydrogenase E2 component (dihydrolipoamide succinyltransferase)